MVMVVMVEQVVTLELVVVEHLVVMFMMVLHRHGLSLLVEAVEAVEVLGMLVEMRETMVEIGKQYLVM
tara:strand:+ start:250 stop:453 length:204 start_codon:yes stop_codon:yes gene_type:complete